MSEEGTLLECWGFTSLIERFEANGVDEEALALLTIDDISALIPEIGIRRKFIKKWKSLYNKDTQPLREISTTFDGTLESNVNCARKLTNVSINQESTSVSNEPSNQNYSQHENSTEQILSNIDSRPQKSPNEISEGDQDENGAVDSCKLQLCGKRKAFVGHQQFNKRMKEEETLCVQNILKKHGAGKLLLTTYENTKQKFLPEVRRTVIDLVVSEIIADENCVMSNADFDHLSTEIVKLFPQERKSSYYIAPIPKHLSRSKKSEPARGALLDRFRNKLKKYRSLLGYKKKVTPTVPRPLDVSEDVRLSASWLKHNKEPWDEVVSNWKKTTVYRSNDLKNSSTSIHDFIKQWCVLETAKGYILIDIDFRTLFESEEAQIYVRWEEFFNKIQSLRQVKNPAAKLLKSYLNNEATSENYRIVVQLLLLSYFLPPKGRVENKIEKEVWKPTIAECQESIIIHVKCPGDIAKVQQERVEKMKKRGRTVQPYILVVGPTLEDISAYYVVIDSIVYKIESPLKAFDICFKSIHVLNAEYPPESEHIYLLVQLALYRFTTQWDKSISYVMSLVDEVTVGESCYITCGQDMMKRALPKSKL